MCLIFRCCLVYVYVYLFFQELDYGALYEVRTPHFYVEANKMPTARVSVTGNTWPMALKFNGFVY